MVNLEEHHRLIRNKAKIIHFLLIPLALAVPLLWIYLSYGVCQEAESPWMLHVCTGLKLTPLSPAVFGMIMLGLIFWELKRLGFKHHAEHSDPSIKRSHLDHAIDGYHLINQEHRKHVHFAAIQVLLVSVGLLVWLIWTSYRSTH